MLKDVLKKVILKNKKSISDQIESNISDNEITIRNYKNNRLVYVSENNKILKDKREV
jgi:hypothetical protein